MKLYFYGFILLVKKFILRQNTGKCILWFSTKMGVVYIKFAQILAMQNYGNLFTEEDRVALSKICDSCNPIKFKKLKKILEKEYGCNLKEKFISIDEVPLGSASISQVHKGILLSGKEVAIKIRRKDITKKINKDIKQIKKLVHRYGRLFKLENLMAGDTALDLFIEWIVEETDFNKEKENIILYAKFASEANLKLSDAVKIKVPYVYKKLCTENVIVMEYIPYKTINKLELTNSNKEKISRALNDYLRISFETLFEGKQVVFHGDPHGGNIYIDKAGNIGFLDMGLLFVLDDEEIDFILNLFLSAYNGNHTKLLKLILNTSKCENVNYESFTNEIAACCQECKNISIPTFFMNMIGVFTKYNVNPPKVLFKLAKCFVAIYGINNFSNNNLMAEKLLYEQITHYYVNRTIKDFKEVISIGVNLVPNLFIKTIQNGFVKGVADEINLVHNFNNKLEKTISNCNEIISSVYNIEK